MGSDAAGPIVLDSLTWQRCTTPTVTTRIVDGESYRFRLGRVASCVWCTDAESCLHHCYLDVHRWVSYPHSEWQRLDRFLLDTMSMEQVRSLYRRLFEGEDADIVSALTQLFLR